tara:strand:+ start:222 stop:1571 length:1350 start_codon:yes stop_codon:yes gene_type:complete
MGWQVGLQAATLLAVGGVSSSVRDQTEVIRDSLTTLQDETIEGFNSVTDAINSLEATLLTGIEDIKWYLGSIDDKLGKLIGLIEYPMATESTEQFKIGMELYKQEFYDKALKCFEASVDKNPLNLNAKVGLYLTRKQLKTKKNKDILIEIVKLTGGNFLFHTKATSEVKENSTNYFVNFCFGELLEAKDYKSIIECYENELEGFSKEHLPIKLKYVNALVLDGKEYDTYFEEILTEGHLEKLMVFFRYEEKNKNVISFLEKVIDFIKIRLPELENLEEKPDQPIIQKKAIFFKNTLEKDVKTLMKLGFFETSLSDKVKALKTFYDAAKSAPEALETAENLKKSNEENLKIIETIQDPKFFKEANGFCIDAQKQIINETNKHIQAYKKKITTSLKKEVTELNKTIKQFSTGYPKLEKDSQESCQIVRTFVSNIDQLNEVISLEKIFAKKT